MSDKNQVRLVGPNGTVVRVSPSEAKTIGGGFAPEGAKAERSSVPDSTWKAPDLKAYAEENGIDLAGAKNKPDVLAAIIAHLESDSDADDDSGDDSEDE